MILSAYPVPKGGSPFNFDHTDYPGLMCWFRFVEGAGTALTDKVGNVSGMTLAGTGTHWGTPYCATFNAATTDYANTALTNILAAMPAPVAGDVWLIEADHESSAGGVIAEIGRAYTSVQTGWGAILLSDYYYSSTNHISMGVRNSEWSTNTPQGTSTAFHTNSDYDASRHHIIGVFDFSNSDNVTLALRGFLDGVFTAEDQVDTTALGGFAGGNFRQGGDFRIGRRSDGGNYFTGKIYNLRVWKLSSYPVNMDLIAAQMASNPDELPPLLEGVS